MRTAGWIVALLALAGCTSAPARGPDLSACYRAPDLAALSACAGPSLDAAARSGKERDLLRAMEVAYRSGALDDCHMLAHHLGHAAFDASRDLNATLRLGSADCFKGYYHGVMEATIAARHREGNDSIVGLCDVVRDNESAWDGCVHGLGHGLMWRSDDDVRASLNACEKLDDAARQRCQGGALMENSLRLVTLNDTDYAAQAPRACDGLGLALEPTDTCGAEIGEVAMFHYRHDETKARAICAAVSDPVLREACGRGIADEAGR